MKNIEQYRKRFNSLLESTMGDVRPLISEAQQFEEFVVPTMDMLKEVLAVTMKQVDTSSRFASSLSGVDDKKINVRTSLNGNEYKITLPEGVYDPNETIRVEFYIDKTLMIFPPNGNNEHSRDNVSNIHDTEKADGLIVNFKFHLPETQEEFSKKQPYNGYVDVRCKNVRGGKIRFSVEVPSGSEIYDGLDFVSGSTPTLVEGPIGKGYLKRYIYELNDRFFIYYSTFKNPEHKRDTSLEDKGRGFQTKDEAMNVILQNTPN